jgi:hypothetical protein
MSHRKRTPRPGYGLPPMTDHRGKMPEATLGPVVFIIREYHILEWCPPGQPDVPTQVHFALMLDPPGTPPMIMRIKSPEACDQLINALRRHRRNVWPDVGDVVEPPADTG